MKTKRYIVLAIATFASLSSIFATKLLPVVISEVFYDSPNNEKIDGQNPQVHHNGEFIELFNPSTSEINLSGWILCDNSNAPYVFPANSKIAARGMVIVAYRHPDTNYQLSELFPSINGLGTNFIQKNIYYQNSFVLCNDGEIITLYDNNCNRIDQMSYRYGKVDHFRDNNWGLSARNGNGTSDYGLFSIQRTNITTKSNLIYCTQSDYTASNPTPFYNSGVTLPIVEELNNSTDAATNGTTPLVGSIPGSASVSPSGAATYTIPIEVPTGINGYQPSIAISYNSQGGWGALGKGWDVTAISTITRGPKNIYFDNKNSNVKFDNSSNGDALYLDGQRLILLSGTHWSVDAVYGTETENYSRVKIKANTDNSIYFELTTLDGKVAEYGKTTDSKIQIKNTTEPQKSRIYSWSINKSKDTYGNEINYTYKDLSSDGIQKSVDRITYANQVVEFNYNTAVAYPRISYLDMSEVEPGIRFKFCFSNLLSEINIYSGATKLKTYTFNYNSSADNRLKSVGLKSADGFKVNNTNINWESSGTSVQFSKIGTVGDTKLSLQTDNKTSIDFADIDGDGHDDRIERWVGSPTQNGFINVYFYDNVNKTFGAAKTATLSVPYFDHSRYHQQFLFTDINNDGKQEIVYTAYGGMYAYSYNSVTKNFDSGFVNGDKFIDTDAYIGDYYKDKLVKFVATDVNKDGYSDIVFAYYNRGVWHSGSRGYAIYLGSSTGLATIPVANDKINLGYQLEQLEIGDFNGDSKLDVVCLPENVNLGEFILGKDFPADGKLFNNEYISFSVSPSWNLNDMNGGRDQVMDINGDGFSDIMAYHTNTVWRSSRNNYGITIAPTKINEPFRGANCKFLDINGDGLVDAVNYQNNYRTEVVSNPNYDGYSNEPRDYTNSYYDYTTWSVYLNSGNGVFSQTPIQAHGNKEIYEPNLITTADVNEDGVADLVITQGTDVCTLTMPNVNRNYLVGSITNGMGQSDSFVYKNFTDYEAYSASESAEKVRPLRTPMTVVDRYLTADGDVTNYSFSRPKFHIEGKGFLGFMTVIASNSSKNRVVTSNYDYDRTYYYPVLTSQTMETVAGVKISTLAQTNNVKTKDSYFAYNIFTPRGLTATPIYKYRYIPITTSQTSKDELTGITQTIRTDYSTFPESLTVETETGGLISTITSTYTKPNALTSATPYLISSEVVTRTQNNQSFTRTTNYSYTYDSTNPYKIIGKTVTSDPGDDNSQETTYSNYDIWGHPQDVSIKAGNIIRTSSVKYYDSSTTETNAGRFLRSKTSVLKERTTYKWDEVNGNLISETDHYNRTTQYRYNSFGQLEGTIFPDGKSNYTKKYWASSGYYNGAKYCIYTETSGTSPVTIWYDMLGREMQKDSYGLNEKKLSVSTEYYSSGVYKGKLKRISEPYFTVDENKKTWAKTYISYDSFDRPTTAATPMGYVYTVYNGLTSKVVTPDGTTETTLNLAAQTISSKVNNKEVSYTYYPSGLVKSTTPEGGQAIEMLYNLQGQRIKMVDPDAGLTRNEYNGFGQVTKEVQQVHIGADSIVTDYYYHSDGRLDYIERNGEVTTYNYDPKVFSRINSIVLENRNHQIVNRKSYGYDSFERVTSVVEEIADKNGVLKSFSSSKVYDQFGRVSKEVYPSGYYTVNSYDQYSNLTEVKDNQYRSIWKVNSENAKGQLTSINKGTKETTFGYDSRGFTTSIYAQGVEDMAFSFNVKGNLVSKDDNLNRQSETYQYDNLNRLTSWSPMSSKFGGTTYSITYSADGTIQTKSDLGNYTFSYGGQRSNGTAIGPHALTGISGSPADFPTADLNVTYTDFKKIATLSEGSKYYTIAYGADDQRIRSDYYSSGSGQSTPTLTRYYVGNYEEEVNSLGNVRKIHYLSGAILIQNNGVDSLLYAYSDFQGSLVALTDASGNVVEKYAYDPWGARRCTYNWSEKDSRTKWILNRGYTGHEHIDQFGIINMNGRVYDPATAMFFSPDPTMTDASNWLDYNKYGYCLGNPFRYTDPTGYTWWAESMNPIVTYTAGIVAAGVVTILTAGSGTSVVVTAMLAGAAGGFTSGTVGTALSGGSFGDCMVAGLQGAAIGGASALFTSAIGGIFGATFGGTAKTLAGKIINEVGRASAHSLVQGAFTYMQGGDFWAGAAAGFISSVVSHTGQLVGIHGWGTVGVSAVSGGLGALVGKNHSVEDVLLGMVSGAMVATFNAVAHENEGDERPSLEDIKNKPPTHPDYKAPKGGDRKVKNPNGSGSGYIDNKGRVWVPTDHKGSHAPHWDVEYPNGTHRNVYPIIPNTEDNSSVREEIGKAVGLSGTALTIYLIISEGSRLFPPRNVIPVP